MHWEEDIYRSRTNDQRILQQGWIFFYLEFNLEREWRNIDSGKKWQSIFSRNKNGGTYCVALHKMREDNRETSKYTGIGKCEISLIRMLGVGFTQPTMISLKSLFLAVYSLFNSSYLPFLNSKYHRNNI